MTRVFFHYHDGVERILDHEGADLDVAEARARALREVRALIAHDVLAGRIDLRQRIDVEDAEGIILDTIAFADAVEIIGLPVARLSGNGSDATEPAGFPRPRHSRLP
ncbi:DUF6894 family protein [Sphingomonas oligophenolica]